MPWTVADVDKHIKGLDDKGKEVWVAAANNARESCIKKGGKDCDAYAIMAANKAAQESMSFRDVEVDDVAEKDVDPNVGGGKDRDKIPEEDFAGKDRSFPIVKPGDVADAAASIGRAGSDNYSTDKLKANIIRIAKRKGEAFVKQLPEAWKEAERLELDNEMIPLTEKSAVSKEGTAMVKIIQPGWGSSGYYSEEVLQRDGPRVFGKGVKMFMDHPTPEEEANRPERSLRDLVGELAEDSVYKKDGPDGPGLYSRVKVFSPYREVINEIGPRIGVSIRGYGKGSYGEIEGRQGRIVEELVAAKSVDYVTAAGAGGRVLELFEAARQRMAEDDKLREAEMEELKEAKEALAKAEASVAELQESAKKRDEEMARMREALILREARDVVNEALAKAEALPDVTKDRLRESLPQNPPVKDGALDKETFAKKIEEAVGKEVEYLTKITGKDPVKGHGNTPDPKPEDVEAKLVEAFKGLGLSENAAKTAAQGR